MPEDFDDTAIKERIQSLSRQIDAILRKVAEVEPTLLSSEGKPAAQSFTPDGPLAEAPPRARRSTTDTDKGRD